MPDVVTTIASTVIFLFAEGGQIPIGTAFIVGFPVPGQADQIVPLIVTAKHVVGDRSKVIGRFTPKSSGAPVSVVYDLASLRRSGDVWEHTDDGVDLLVFRTPHFEQAEYIAVPFSAIASRTRYSEEDIKATDRIIFPCLLVNFMGTARNYPVIRNGSIALIPDEPVPLQYKVGNRQISTKQSVLLVDATSIPGASGSPVFLWPGPRLKANAFHLGGQAWLLGVMHGFYPALPRELVGIETTRVVPGFSENSGIAIMFPSWRLLEILERPEVTKRIEGLLQGQK